MRNYIKNIGFIIGIFSLIFVGCKDNIDPIVEKLDFSRVFTPLNLSVKIRNMTTAEITWDTKSDAESYVLEISKDSLQFNNIVETITVTPDQIPYSVLLDGQTVYSARIKGVSNSGIADSKWAVTAFKTDAENIFAPLAGENIKATSVILNWPAGSDVTNFLITPGDVNRTITDQEKADGMATITGLTGETTYTVLLFRGPSQRGKVEFTTLVDLGNATPVHPEDDLVAMIAAANEGDAFVLFPGEYLTNSASITLNKSISIKGLYPYDKPVVHAQFILEDGVQTVEIKDIDMDGVYVDSTTSTESKLSYAFQYNTTSTSYGNLNVIGCNIHDYDKSIFSGSSSIVSSIQSILMDDCVVTNVLTNSADCIDFRGGYVASLSLKNSTFVNCAPARDFIRLDNSSSNFPGMVSNVLIDHCTLYKVSNTAGKRILYVRFTENKLTVTNTIIAETAGLYTNQSLSSQPDCSMNNYFNAPAFVPGGTQLAGAKFDLSDNLTVLDPGFADAASGNFTISNQTLIDNKVGDPRW
ncbi:MAG: DUF5123 domain-containing protein [Prolixibacteraceae bacterium]